MYSYEDRMRAVQLYIKLGKRANATICQLGYPTKNALKHWYRELSHGDDLSAGYVRTKQRYSDEQKRIAVEHMWPAKSDGTVDETILQLRALLMMPHLVYGRLADINVGELAAMLGGDLAVGTIRRSQHADHLCRHTD